MKKNLIRDEELYHYKDEERISGTHAELTGECTGLRGDLDDCEITDEERLCSIPIERLVDYRKPT